MMGRLTGRMPGSSSPTGLARVLAVLVLVLLLNATSRPLVPKSEQPVKARAQTSTLPFGWDYNLSRRCVKSTAPGSANYFEDTTQCNPDDRNWTVAVQSERELGVSCPGPVNQSLPINTSDSPLSLQWTPHIDEVGRANWSVNLTTDLSAQSHPCGAGYFTWYVFMDHIGHNGGPLPNPRTISLAATVNFNDFTPVGATRAIAGWQGFWNGKARSIEVNMVSTNWGDAHPDPDIVNVIDNEAFQFVNMDGPAMGLGISKNVDTPIRIDWYRIIQNLIDRGIFPAPIGGWGQGVSTAVFLGHETNNLATAQSAISSMWLTNFRIEGVRLPGDFDGDGRVDQTDVTDFRVHYPPAGYNATYDLNTDGIINASDAGILFSHWTG